MKFSMVRKFAFQNLKANKTLEIPFIISSALMFILLNIMASLVDNEYVRTRHSTLPMIINFGIAIVVILAVVFTIYSTNFLLRRRNKEFALYGILGLEKKHIRKIITVEFLALFLIIAAISVVGGYVFGQLTFLGLNRLLKDISGGLMEYPFSVSAMIITVGLIGILYIFTVVRSSFRIYLSTPVALLNKQHSGEGEPKSRWIIMLLGFVSLAAGYYIALTTKGILSSLAYFFLASLFVIIATYLLYVTFSVIVLKAQKQKKSYYKPLKFLGISGLLYRMKSNAISLASISILSVGVIIVLSATATIYSNIKEAAYNTMPREYQLESGVPLNENNYKVEKKNIRNKVEKTVDRDNQITEEFVSYTMTTTGLRKGDSFEEYTKESSGVPNYIMVYDLDSYNSRTNQDIKLKDNEVLMCANQTNMVDMEHITVGERKFKVNKIENIVPSNYAVEVYCIIVKDFKTMKYIGSTLRTVNMKTMKFENASITCIMDWNVKGINESKYNKVVNKLGNDNGYEVGIQSEYISNAYDLNGGFLFLGVVIGLIFLIGAILITYYKQISEGYEDREKYQIMKKVGLTDNLIKKTAQSQIIWIFFTPLIIAIIHSLVASKIVYQLLGLFAVRSFMEYGKFFMAVIAMFFVIYFVIFKLTSRAYYKIVQ